MLMDVCPFIQNGSNDHAGDSFVKYYIILSK